MIGRRLHPQRCQFEVLGKHLRVRLDRTLRTQAIATCSDCCRGLMRMKTDAPGNLYRHRQHPLHHPLHHHRRKMMAVGRRMMRHEGSLLKNSIAQLSWLWRVAERTRTIPRTRLGDRLHLYRPCCWEVRDLKTMERQAARPRPAEVQQSHAAFNHRAGKVLSRECLRRREVPKLRRTACLMP